MEEFIDYLLYLILIVVLIFSGTLVFFLLKDPPVAYRILGVFLCGVAGGIGLFVTKFLRKKRLGAYYDLSRELPQLQKEIQRSTKRLERHSRKIIQEQEPKIKKLCAQAKQHLKKIVDIEKTLNAFEKKQMNNNPLTSLHPPIADQDSAKLYASQERYLRNIRRIEESKHQHLQQIHNVVRVLHELNSQILALRFSEEKHGLQEDIAETIDELLIDMQSLEEVTQKKPFIE